MDGVFVGSGIFKSSNPSARAKVRCIMSQFFLFAMRRVTCCVQAIVAAVSNYNDPLLLAGTYEQIAPCGARDILLECALTRVQSQRSPLDLGQPCQVKAT
jgi:pyridoxal biosynthesis lyase PdxS